MKSLLLGFTVLSFVLFFNGVTIAQELAKPIPNKVAQKQATIKNGAPNDDSSSTTTKSGSHKKNELDSSNSSSQVETKTKEVTNLATKDNDEYQAKKIKWISENPEKYKAMSGNPNLVIITETEFQVLSTEEKSKILANPDNYFIIQ